MRLFLGALLCVCLMASTATAQIIYFSDFEADQGGWVGTGDWEWGFSPGLPGPNDSTEPLGGFSGDNVWGTVLGDSHSPSANDSLTQAFDLSGLSDATLTFWEWSDSGDPDFDTASVNVNGTQEYLSDGNSLDAWRLVTIDLTPYAGQSNVNIDFNFTSSFILNRTGWYIDDVRITSSTVPEPASAIVLCLVSGLAMVRRR